jgi:thiol-disulfide isomerase/thioredoxin
MTLTGTKGQVFQSKISGSVIQDQYFEYIISVAKLQNEVKQILDSVKTYPNLSEDKKSEMRVRFHSAQKMIEEKSMDFINNNPNYYCTAPELVFYLTFFPDKIERKKLNEFCNKMNPVTQLNDYRTQLETFLFNDKETVKSQPLEVGDYPFNFALKDTDGNEIKFTSITSKVILLDFWASGCGPCRLEHKNYLALYKEFKDKGFEIVSVNQDQSKKRLLEAMKKDEMSWISLWDEHKKVSNGLYNVSSLPTNYLIIDGKIVAKTLTGEQLRQKIEGVLSKTKN